MSARKLFLLAVAFSFVTSVVGAPAAQARLHSCEYSFIDTTPLNPRLADRRTVERVPWSEAEIEGPIKDRSVGVLKFHEQPLSNDPKVAIREMIDGLSENSARWFSFKEYKQGGALDTGRFVLAVPLINGHVVELVYAGEFSGGNRHYRLDRVVLTQPFQDPFTIESFPLTPEGRLNPEMMKELSQYPQISAYNFNVGIAPVIPMSVLAKFDPVAEKLGFSDKDVMQRLTKVKGYSFLAARLRLAWIVEYASTYILLKGPFKRVAALVVGAAFLGVGWVILPDGTIRKVKDYLDNPDPLVMEKSLSELAGSQGMPEEIKKQVVDLRKEVLSTVDPNGTQSRDLIREHKPTTDAPNKLVISEEKAAWVQRVVDADSGQEVPILFVSRFNGQDKMEFSGVKLDPTRHASLIKYIEGRGQFIPFGSGALKQGTQP